MRLKHILGVGRWGLRQFFAAMLGCFGARGVRPLLRALVLAALAASSITVTSPARAFDRTVLEVQQLLVELGYDAGIPDGISGQRTRSAIQAFLTEENADPSLSGDALLDALRRKVLATRAGTLTTAQDSATPDASALPVEIVPQAGANQMLSVALSPDGDLVLTGSYDNAAKLWDVASGRLLRSFKGHDEGVVSATFSPDGRLVLTGSGDTTAKLWDAASGRLLRSFEGHSGGVKSVVFSPEGNQVLTGSVDNTAKLWDVASGRLLRTFKGHSHQVSSVAFSPDGRQVLTGSWDNTVKLWSAASGQLVRTLEGHSHWVTSVAFSPDGRQVLTGSWDNTAKLWDASNGKLLRSAGHSSWVWAVAFSPDGSRILTGSEDNTARLWDTASGRQLRTLEGHSSDVMSVVFSTDGSLVLTGSGDDTAKLWDSSNGSVLRTFGGISDQVSSVALSTDGGLVLTGSWDNTARLWDAAGGRMLRTFEGHASQVTSVALSPDGSRVLTGSWDETARLWDAASGRLVRSFGGHVGGVNSVAFSPDGRLVLIGSGSKVMTASHNNNAKLWDAASGQLLRTFEGHSQSVNSVAFSPDGSLVLTGSGSPLVPTSDGDNTARLWDAASGQVLRTFGGQSGWVTSVAFSPDGSLVLIGSGGPLVPTGDGDNSARLWDAASGQLLRTLGGHLGGVTPVAFSSDSSQILTGGAATARLWDATSGRLLRSFEGHSSWVTSVAFSPDGSRVLTGSGDSTIGYWDPQTGARLASSIAFNDGEWVTITPEGYFDASAHGPEQLSVVRGLEVHAIDQVYQALYRPDLVAEALKGDPDGKVAAAAAKLDLTAVIGSGAAPRVVIAAPDAGTEIAEDMVEVTAGITDLGGGIGKIEWRVNGITLGIDARGFDRLAIDQQVADASGSVEATPIQVTQTLSLDPGENVIEVVAYNEKGLIASDPASVTVTWDGVSASTPPRLHVLAVGVDDYYDSRLQLTYAVSDARAIGAAFTTAGSELYESVEVTTVLDADVTAANLDAVFAELGSKVRPRDVFVLFMAGHGKTQDGRYYFLPADFRYVDETSIASGGIDQDQFQEWLAQIPARKSVLLYDTCDSGSLTTGVASRGLEEVAALARMTRAMGRTVLSASTDDAPALEGYNGHGVFTYALLQALGDGDTNGDGTIEVTELAGAIDRQVPEISFAAFNLRQIPQMSIVGSDFPLAQRVAVLNAIGSAPNQSTIPTTPTHVVIAATDLREQPDDTATTVKSLEVGLSVRVLETTGDWSLLARDGARIGYVKSIDLVGIQ